MFLFASDKAPCQRGFRLGSKRLPLTSIETRLTSITLVLTLSLLFPLVGCNTKAVGVQQCREIEEARCYASVHCGVVDEDGVEDCIRFYRDHCLHGIAGSDDPTADQQKQCVSLIERAGELAEETRNDEEMETEHRVACTTVSEPWNSKACAFLLPDPEGMGGGM